MPGRTQRRRRTQAGTALIEFTLVILPVMGFLLMTIDLAWIIFGWASIQEAVREGVRSAVTCTPTTGLNASIQNVVEQYSFGFVNSRNVSTVFSVQYLSPTTLSPISGSVTTGDVVRVSVSGLSVGTFGPIFRRWTPVQLAATSSDVMSCPTPATP